MVKAKTTQSNDLKLGTNSVSIYVRYVLQTFQVASISTLNVSISTLSILERTNREVDVARLTRVFLRAQQFCSCKYIMHVWGKISLH